MNEVEQIKESIDIVEFIRQYVELHKAGANWKGVCPFHSEKTASFMVSADKQIFKCFGCGEGGDVFEFLMKIENLTFYEALQMLADRTGIRLPQHTKAPKEYAKEKDIKSAAFKINDLSTRVFNKILLEHASAKQAREYLKKRKIDEKMIEKYMVGYAPAGRVLLGFLKKRGFSDQDIRNAGNPDKFYNRIVFPIRDRLGNVVAFTGRTIEKDVEPKYLNTAETMIFHKSKTLYGLDIARESIREKKQVILVEGQMDVVLSSMASVENVVATSGTALTEDHLKILSRYGADIVFCFDRDEAGKNAQKKAIKMAYNLDISTYVIEIPEKYKDVGDIVEADVKKWKEVSKNTKPSFDWLLETLFSQYGQNLTAGDKKNIMKEIAGYLQVIKDPMEKNYYKKATAIRFGITDRIIDEVLNKFEQNKEVEKKEERNIKNKKISSEEYLVGLVLIYGKFIKIFLENISENDIENQDVKTVYKAINDCYNNLDKKNLSHGTEKKVFACVEKNIGSDLFDKVKFFVMEVQDQVKDLKDDEIEQLFSDYVARIKSQSNKKIKEDFARLISSAEEKKDIGQVKKLLEQFQNKISKK